MAARFRAAWRTIPHADRRLLLDYFVGERPMPAIAVQAGCSPTAAHKRSRRALERLRLLMAYRPPARPRASTETRRVNARTCRAPAP
jgi:DNA-directed RNA polymerase specialized sigma24 family protein